MTAWATSSTPATWFWGGAWGSIAASGDFILLVTHPPLYPWLLAALGKAGLDLVAAARWIDIVLFGGFLFAGGWGFWRVTRSAWLALGLTSILLVHPAFLLAYLSAMSEPLFLFCIVSSLLLMADYLVNGKGDRLVLSAGAAAGALMSALPRRRRDRRLRGRFVAAHKGRLASEGPRQPDLLSHKRHAHAGVCAVDSLCARRQEPARRQEQHRSRYTCDEFHKACSQLRVDLEAAAPRRDPQPIAPVHSHTSAGCGCGRGAGSRIGLGGAGRRPRPPATPSASRGQLEWRPAGLFALFLASYLGFFFAAYLVTSPTPDVDARTLLPLLPGGLLLVFALGDVIRNLAPPSRLFGAVLAATIVGSLAGWSIISQDMVLGMHRTGLGYTSRAWRSSETIGAVEALPTDLTLVSNETAAVLLYTDRSAYEIPGLKAGDVQPLSVPFGSGSSDLDRAYRDGHAALVLFNTVKGQLKSGPDAVQALAPGDLTEGLMPIFEGNDGAIYCKCAISVPAGALPAAP